MNFEDTLFNVEFKNSKEVRQISLSTLVDDTIDFLEHYGEESITGKEFYAIIGQGDGETKFKRLLKTSGYENYPKGFFSELIGLLEGASSNNKKPIKINEVALPQLLLVSLLEKIIPGKKSISIKDVAQLEKLTNIKVQEKDREDLQEVIEKYPVRLSMHTIRQMMVSKNVAYQYLPFVEELDPAGQVNTWIGQFHQGLLEQMYQNRVIFLLNMSCPVYCRFCFRKHKETRNETNPTTDDVKKAVSHIRDTPSIKEIVITGGDPFLNKANMECAIDGLKEIPHVQTLRLATRSISYYPHLFYANNSFWLNYLKRKNLELQQRGKRIEIATHFIHPDEISPQCLDIISDFVRNGMAVYVQTPFLKGCNDEGPELTRLFSLLRGAGAELHYIYIPCSSIQGNSVYWTPISKGLKAAEYLRAHLSDRVIPRITTATQIGKMDWHTSGWAVEKDIENDRFIWIRTPYTPGYFKEFAPIANELDIVRVNAEGTIDIKFMAQIGDDNLFLGPRKPRSPDSKDMDKQALENLRSISLKDQRIPQSIVSTGSSTLFRTHETRVEIGPEASEKDIEYIRNDGNITDVVISSQKDAVECLYSIGKIINKLQGIHHVNAVRLRSIKFNYAPEKYTDAVIERLGNLNCLTVVNPLRLEVETQFLHSSEIKPDHSNLMNRLHNKGITVYNNTPLLSGINDNPDEINKIAYKCREIGIEFHHLYVAGLPLQKMWGEKHPVDIQDVIDIATRVRRDGSGREIPRYIILTELGEVDFGLTCKMFSENGGVSVKSLPYDLGYFKAMEPEFSWPSNVRLDIDDKPIIHISGLINTADFYIS
ncbi:MAG: radical SAM protein [Thermodesulfobacteriota bacterium]|nr:radical SAM protein [Thermodesulfobacteriota bacterium]